MLVSNRPPGASFLSGAKRGPVIAVASGKGGTGKTTVALNMAISHNEIVSLADCDVEAPNAHLFFGDVESTPVFETYEDFAVAVPAFDESLCDGCGRCKKICKFNAITIIAGKPLFFNELCHSCAACFSVCPTDAISVASRKVGTVRKTRRDNVELVDGALDVGESKAPPLIRAVKRAASKDKLTIVDAPPGTSCSMVAAVHGSDYVVLVTEPTPFGLSDLALAVETVRQIGVPFGVAINKFDGDLCGVDEFCRSAGIDIIGVVRFDREIAGICSRGGIVVRDMPAMTTTYRGILAAALGVISK